MAEIWFTSDEHYLHDRIIELCNRPFGSAEEMTETLVENHNARVGRGDTVYHLGDFCFWDIEKFNAALKILRRLNGDHTLILGNHDSVARLLPTWKEVTPAKEIRIGKTPIYLHHYGCRVWPASYKPQSLHLYGHSHNNLPGNSQSCDVGVDSWGYAPVNLEQIRARLATLPPYVPEDFKPEPTEQ